MKKISNIIFAFILLFILSCNSTPSENDLVNNCTENEYLEKVQLMLVDYEDVFVSSLQEAQSISDFHSLLNTKFSPRTEDETLKSDETSKHHSEKDSLMRLALDNFKSSIFDDYEDIRLEETKEEFLTYLNIRKEGFVNEIGSMDFIKTKQDKDILIALLYLEIGLVEVNLEYLDEIISLEQDFKSKNILKSVNSCNWWCFTKHYTKCMLLSQGFAGSIGAMLAFPGAQFVFTLSGLGFSWFAYDCWVDLYNKMNNTNI